jgi:hypothetical protein
MTNADLIWNRATLERGSSRFALGDRALSSLLMAHNLAMNGGVFHAVELLNDKELRAALDGYPFFGFTKSAALLSRARNLFERGENLEEYEKKLDREYAQYIPDDSALALRFEQHFDLHPEDFAPL